MNLIKFDHTRLGKVVTIGVQPNDEENLTKTLTVITYPVSTQKQSEGETAKTSKVIDLLLKAEQRITIMGFLFSATISGDSSTTASGRKTDLKEIFLGGGVCQMTYEGTAFNVAIEKLSIRRLPTAYDSTGASVVADGEAEFSVQMTCVRGDDFGS